MTTTTGDDHAHRRRGRRVRRTPVCPARTRVCPERDLPRFTQLVAEVLAGERALEQLRPRLSEGAYRSLRLRAGRYCSDRSPRLRRTRLGCPEPGIAEVSGVVAYGARHRALALRVVYGEYGWLCTHIETDIR
ncbi:Rv3235 family protein [Actinorugispora endophytica]|uniref:Uncharacterized protein n=1 Tax=Actinorugispora endophytica TaxID=1605990 RepID=A0A4R6USZ3_9ACTN|nr:Rv3235 family protein [Actinorugispora endophytica]TDQ50242.1 hypothetical protein EV190_11311 [Actinorugispora endophytica]